ncbi:uncharacterized protein VTP21DRAFT_11475 [Calcarisporiella thermophila]|uniref:uncharacterized protein n=1 Tax=Calcarisporiella thermophila TaxID=911321 RepID=UPI003744ADF8
MGHLTYISEELVKISEARYSELGKDIQAYLEDPEWQNYIQHTLAETKERNQLPLGGIRPAHDSLSLGVGEEFGGEASGGEKISQYVSHPSSSVLDARFSSVEDEDEEEIEWMSDFNWEDFNMRKPFSQATETNPFGERQSLELDDEDEDETKSDEGDEDETLQLPGVNTIPRTSGFDDDWGNPVHSSPKFNMSSTESSHLEFASSDEPVSNFGAVSKSSTMDIAELDEIWGGPIEPASLQKSDPGNEHEDEDADEFGKFEQAEFVVDTPANVGENDGDEFGDFEGATSQPEYSSNNVNAPGDAAEEIQNGIKMGATITSDPSPNPPSPG